MKKLNKKSKNKNSSINKKNAIAYQFGGFNPLDKDFMNRVSNSWKGVMSNPYDDKSQGYLNNLLNNNDLAGRNRIPGNAQDFISPYNGTIDPNSAAYRDNSNRRPGHNQGLDLSPATTLDPNSTSGLDVLGAKYYDNEGQLDTGDYYGSKAGSSHTSTSDAIASGALTGNKADAYSQFGTDLGNFKTNQLVETGAGIMGLMNSQSAYDSKPKEANTLNTIGTQGLKRFQSGGNINIPSSSLGLYKHPNGPVNVPTPTGAITMQGIDQQVLAIPNNDSPMVMQPNKEYNFNNSNNVLEIPLGNNNMANKNNKVAHYQYGGKTWEMPMTTLDSKLSKKYKPRINNSNNNIKLEERGGDARAALKSMGYDISEDGTRIINPSSGSTAASFNQQGIQDILKGKNKTNSSSTITPRGTTGYSNIGSGKGRSPSQVKDAQKFLKSQGANIKVDGKWGKNTEKAFNNFYNKNTSAFNNSKKPKKKSILSSPATSEYNFKVTDSSFSPTAFKNNTKSKKKKKAQSESDIIRPYFNSYLKY